MESNPLITVYITNYNYSKYIRKAIESVLSQTLQDFELIIIDDGSSDNSKEIIEEYSSWNNIYIIYQKNKGLNITNNVALKASKGKYIVRLDADDFLHSNALAEMSSILEMDNDLGLIFPDYFIVDAEGNKLSEIKRHDFSNDVTILDQPAHGACTMIRVDFLKTIGGYDESYKCQDGYELWVKFINKYKVINVNKTLFSYRRHNNNLTNNEDRILSTRLKIKHAYVKKQSLDLPKTAAVIPLRPNYNLTFEMVGDTTFIDYKINQALNSENVLKVIITTSDSTVKEYISDNYSNDKVIFIARPEITERINVSLFETLNYLSSHETIKGNFNAFIFCSVACPFIDSNIIDDAINTLTIFNADSLVSVRPENSKFYRHTGNGMRAILEQDNFTKLERESIYKYTGGVILANINSSIKHKKLVHGNVGHIVVSEKAALNVESGFNKQLCNMLLNNSVYQ